MFVGRKEQKNGRGGVKFPELNPSPKPKESSPKASLSIISPMPFQSPMPSPQSQNITENKLITPKATSQANKHERISYQDDYFTCYQNTPIFYSLKNSTSKDSKARRKTYSNFKSDESNFKSDDQPISMKITPLKTVAKSSSQNKSAGRLDESNTSSWVLESSHNDSYEHGIHKHHGSFNENESSRRKRSDRSIRSGRHLQRQESLESYSWRSSHRQSSLQGNTQVTSSMGEYNEDNLTTERSTKDLLEDMHKLATRELKSAKLLKERHRKESEMFKLRLRRQISGQSSMSDRDDRLGGGSQVSPIIENKNSPDAFDLEESHYDADSEGVDPTPGRSRVKTLSDDEDSREDLGISGLKSKTDRLGSWLSSFKKRSGKEDAQLTTEAQADTEEEGFNSDFSVDNQASYAPSCGTEIPSTKIEVPPLAEEGKLHERMKERRIPRRQATVHSEYHTPISTPRLTQGISRVDFTRYSFVQKCSIGNTDISLKNVTFIDRKYFEDQNKLKTFEEWQNLQEDGHPDCLTTASELGANEVVLFVSHRWQLKTLPDADALQLRTIKLFLTSTEIGQNVTKIWIDYGCIPQEWNSPAARWSFQQKLDNIQTAIFLSHVFVIIPRLSHLHGIKKNKGKQYLYTDLKGYTRRGWCLFEVVTAILARSIMYVTFTLGLVDKVRFFDFGNEGISINGGLNPQLLRSSFSLARDIRYYKVVARVVKEVGKIPSKVKNNWNSAHEPGRLIRSLAHSLEHHLKKNDLERMVSLTMSTKQGIARMIFLKLPDFTSEADRVIVTNLLSNISGFCWNGFQKITPSKGSVLQQLVDQNGRINDQGQFELDLQHKSMFAKDLGFLLGKIHEWRSDLDTEWILRLDENPLGYNGFRLLMAFSETFDFHELSLYKTGMGNVGAVVFGEVLKETITLTTARLGENNIGDEGAVAIGKALKHNSTLTTLDLQRNGIADIGAEGLAEGLLANSSLKILQLNYNLISAQGALAFAKAVKNNNSIVTLDLMHNRIGAQGALAIAKVFNGKCSVSYFGVSNNFIGADGAVQIAEALQKNDSMQILNLQTNLIGDIGAEAIGNTMRNNDSLETINLYNNDVGNDGANAIAFALSTNSSVTNLNLEYNVIGDNGAIAISLALRRNTSLQYLNLQDNDIGFPGAEMIAGAIRSNNTLRSLNLKNNEIRDKGAKELSEALQSNYSLLHLNLMRNGIGDEGGVAIGEAIKCNNSLIDLNLEDNTTGEAGAMAIAEALAVNSSLQSLNLQCNYIGGLGAASIGESLQSNTSLTNLNLRTNNMCAIGAKGISAGLCANCSVHTLDLRGNNIRNEGAICVAEALEANEALTRLNLTGNCIGAKGALALSDALKKNSTLNSLILRANDIGIKGAEAIAEALETSAKVAHLDLWHNGICDQGTWAISEALKENQFIVTLNLGHNKICSAGAETMIETLKTNSTLHVLDLGYNEISEEVKEALLHARLNHIKVYFS